MNRREALRSLAAFAAASPLLAQEELGVMGPVNVHEFEEVAKQKLSKVAYDFIAGGVEDELTLRANRAAFEKVFIVPRVMTDVRKVSIETELLGLKLESPIVIAPTGGKNLVIKDAETVMAQAAASSKVLLSSGSGFESLPAGTDLMWWPNTLGAPTKALTERFLRRAEDRGARGILVTVDNQYQSNRDRNNRNRFDYGYMQSGGPKPGDPKPKPVLPATAAMWAPHANYLTWEYMDWAKSATKLPIILKGILAPEDAATAVERGADAIVVSNHGGRQLDGAIATLDALPDVVQAAGGKVPVLMDGGIRRGTDILKALALGAKAVLVGRAPLWGMGAFGQAGVERVLWMLAAELKLALALAGKANLGQIDRKLARRA